MGEKLTGLVGNSRNIRVGLVKQSPEADQVVGVGNYRKFLSLPKLTPCSLVNIRSLPLNYRGWKAAGL
jgi:hypothetical protein